MGLTMKQLSTQEAAEYLGLRLRGKPFTRRYVQRLIAENKLKHKMIGNVSVVYAKDLDAFIEQRTAEENNL